MLGLDRPSFAREGRDWPLRQYSRFVEAGGLRWHVQRLGAGPPMLLLHGTAGATHSWRDLAPLLAESFEIFAPDLPGHGFTDAKPATDFSLPGVAKAVAGLLNETGFAPEIVVGHSAGAAIAARLCLNGVIAPRLLVGINAALKPFPGWAGALFPSLAKMISANPWLPRLFAWSAAIDREAAARLIAGMGSRLDRRGLDLYARLLAKSGHCAGALEMMANWRLEPLLADLPRLAPRLLLIVGVNDRAVSPAEASRVAARLARARVEALPNVGHLAHEENPKAVARLILAAAAEP
jgi:magnesium chelatase accessory protein